jgi:hypothetical protein
MEKLISMMSEMIKLQNDIINTIEYAIEDEYESNKIYNKSNRSASIPTKKNQPYHKDSHTPQNSIDYSDRIYADKLETVEKNYLLLDSIIKNMYDLIMVSRNQKDKLYKYATHIRTSLNKEIPLDSNNKFINVLNSHFTNGSDIQFSAKTHKDMYESVRRYHELNDNSIQNSYRLYKSVALYDQYNVDMAMVNKLSDIPPMFHWYSGDKKNTAGVYICLTDGVYIQVPFPDLISKNSKNFKHKSVPCKYKTTMFCREKQEDYSRLYNTELRQCNFVHIGESFIKIGSDFRCPNLPSFGAYETLGEDLMLVSLSDIKTMLFNSSSDLLLILLWRKYHMNLGEIIFTNLDKLTM